MPTPPKKSIKPNQAGLIKCLTGIKGFDEITNGGLPAGRPTLVVGAAGAGKTIFGMEFLVHGAMDYGEAGVFISFEETSEELTQNVASLGFDLKKLQADNRIIMDNIRVERSEIEETGEYDLEGLFIRIGNSIDSIAAKRVVLDTIEALFSGFSNEMILRSELRRLFAWLKGKGVTAIITAEKGQGSFTRHGLEEYVSDAVIFLDHRIENQISTRQMRVVKYRGSSHGTNEYPFLIGKSGFEVLPITSLSLKHEVSSERISSGIKRLDTMLGGKGYYRGSTILVSGTAGSGKTSLATNFAAEACRRGEKCLYYAYEESENQVIRNMRSIGLDLEPWIKNDLLRFIPINPASHGLEIHLALLHEEVSRFNPRVVIIDPMSALVSVSTTLHVRSMFIRLIDFLKSKQITTFITSLTPGNIAFEMTETGISSLMDTWLLVRDLETNGERTRGLYILKSRGMAHSNQVREFILSKNGIELKDVYVGAHGLLTGSARLTQEALEKSEALMRGQEIEHLQRLIEQKRKKLEAEISALQSELAAEEAETQLNLTNLRAANNQIEVTRTEMAESRQADN
jgi:circadian clock protein KaiC